MEHERQKYYGKTNTYEFLYEFMRFKYPNKTLKTNKRSINLETTGREEERRLVENGKEKQMREWCCDWEVNGTGKINMLFLSAFLTFS